jgi:hypothetical protein
MVVRPAGADPTSKVAFGGQFSAVSLVNPDATGCARRYAHDS